MSSSPDPGAVIAYVGVLLAEARRTAGRWPVTAEAAYRLCCGWPTLADAVPDNGFADDVLAVDFAEAGRRLGGVSEWTVRRMCDRGSLRAVQIGDRPMIRITDLSEFVAGLPARTAKGAA